MSRNIIGLRIKELRKQKGLTQKQLSEKIGVSRTTINKYENGYFTPSHKQLKSLCMILECEEAFLCEVDESTVDNMFIKDKIFDYLVEQAVKFRYPDVNEYTLNSYKLHIEDAFTWIDTNLVGMVLLDTGLEDIDPPDYDDLSEDDIAEAFRLSAEIDRELIEEENNSKSLEEYTHFENLDLDNNLRISFNEELIYTPELEIQNIEVFYNEDSIGIMHETITEDEVEKAYEEFNKSTFLND